MKYIIDFDDVLFNTAEFKKLIFSELEIFGIPKNESILRYAEIRKTEKPFSLKKFVSLYMEEKPAKDLYVKIMSHCPFLLNSRLLDAVRRVGRENCYIVTHGDKEFQEAKIRESGIWNFFTHIQTTSVGKKEQIEEICRLNPKEEVVFIDDRPEFITEKGLETIPNLTPMIYTKERINEILGKFAPKENREMGKH